jgi:hypothetical protein
MVHLKKLAFGSSTKQELAVELVLAVQSSVLAFEELVA